MVKKILIGSLLFTLAVFLFFLYENNSFNIYLSTQTGSDMNIPMNQNAPVNSKSMAEISAPIDTVWEVLTQIDEWPTWQNNVTESKLIGELKEGASFKWKAGGLSFNSRIHTIKSKSMFGWTGKTFGASAIHNWRFQENNNSTIVTVEESLQGVFPTIFKKYFQRNLDEGVKLNLEELKAASEIKMK